MILTSFVSEKLYHDSWLSLFLAEGDFQEECIAREGIAVDSRDICRK